MTVIARKLRSFWNLGPTGRGLVLRFLGTVPLVAIGFQTLGVPRTQSILRRWSGKTARKLDSATRADLRVTTRKLHGMWLRYLRGKGNCLLESLTLWALLRRRGFDCELRVGFKSSEGRLQGHAWLEDAGIPLNEEAAAARSYATSPEASCYDRATKL